MAELTRLGHRAVTNAPAMDVDQYLAGLPGREAHRPVIAREPVSGWAIHAWCDVMGERGSAYTGENPLAPPATLQMWTFPGLAPGSPIDAGPATPGDLDFEVRARLAGDGLTATLATATDQEFRADLRPGDLVTARDNYTSASPLRDTALGRGHFLFSRTTYTRSGRRRGRVVGPDGLRLRASARCGSCGFCGSCGRPGVTAYAISGVGRKRFGSATQRRCRPPRLSHPGDADIDRGWRVWRPVTSIRSITTEISHGPTATADIVMNILTTNGLLSRVVGEWSGAARLTRLVTRLRAPAYPHHTLTIGGVVADVADGRAPW